MRPRAFPGLSRAVLIIAVSGLGTACSSDVARFDENPFRTRQVASAPPQVVRPAPVMQVEAAPLPARDFVVAQPPVHSAPVQAAPAAESSPFGGGDPGLTTGTVTQRPNFGSSNPATPAVRRMVQAPAQAPAPASVAAGRGGWSAAGGTTIQAVQGDTPEALSRRYGVPAAAIAQVNGIGGNQAFAAGQSVVIPTYSMAAAQAPAVQAPAARPPVAQAPAVQAPAARAATDLVRQPPAAADRPRVVRTEPIRVPAPRTVAAAPAARPGWQVGAQPAAAASPQAATRVAASATPPRHQPARPAAHTVTSGETLAGVARRYGLTRQQVATANGIETGASLRIGQSLRLPATTATASAVPAPAAAPATPAARREQAQRAVAQARATPAGRQADPQTTAAIPPSQPALAAAEPPAAAAPAPRVAAEPAREAAPAAAQAVPAAPPLASGSAEPQFRWPVRGRVVTGFRAGTSDGIKLAVPQGTAVKAAEDGVVAYAGNELRGYGNLVLVRHSNGYVTAYAHNAGVSVRRGEQVRRGQTIATAGQTGNVSSPQLHFEIRRGATPVDPLALLGSN